MKVFVRALVVTLVVMGIVLLTHGVPPDEGRERAADQPSKELQAKEPRAAETEAKESAAAEPQVTESQRTESQVAKTATPKPLSPQALKGIDYLVAQQQADGGWGQGGGWRQASGARGGRVEGKDVKDPSDVANTAMALLVLLRAGGSPDEGRYAAQLSKGLDFLNRHIEAADKESLYVTDVRDTQLQLKIGPYVDTFAATWALSEVKGRMGEKTPSRLLAAVDKCIAKIERHQKDDGTFNRNHAWAAVLSQGLCGVAINAAAQNGVKVNPAMLDRDFKLATNGINVKKGTFDLAASAPAPLTARVSAEFAGDSGVARESAEIVAGSAAGSSFAAPSTPSNAGIELYQLSVQSAQLNAKVATDAPVKKKYERTLSSPSATVAEKEAAQKSMFQLDDQEEAAIAAHKAVAAKAADKRFVAGFGNNGGEEFLSYMNISLALHVKGGPEWLKWDQQATEQVNRVQNNDGSWSGNHCITGRTFCTAAALLTLMADRALVAAAGRRNVGAVAPAQGFCRWLA